jgi:hypothetical protein
MATDWRNEIVDIQPIPVIARCFGGDWVEREAFGYYRERTIYIRPRGSNDEVGMGFPAQDVFEKEGNNRFRPWKSL